MSKEDAQRMLDALENQEKKTMEKVNEQKVRQQPKKKSDKDWYPPPQKTNFIFHYENKTINAENFGQYY